MNSNTVLLLSTYQISTYTNYVSSLAVDGNFSTFSCTNMNIWRPWWAVKLAQSSNVTGVLVTNYWDPYWGEVTFSVYSSFNHTIFQYMNYRLYII